MKTSLTRIALVVAVMTGSTGIANADTFDAQAEINALRAEVQQLRAASNDTWLNERRTEEVKSLIREVLADADTRASLAEGGMTAGHNGKKFFLASEDGGFLMNIEGQIQFRWVYNSRDDADTDEVDAHESGFTIRRTKLKFSGHIADPKLHYEVQVEVDRGDNNMVGDVILIGYDLTDDLTIKVGEGKTPFLREEFTSSKRQLAVERSLVNELFTLDVVQGIFLSWDAHASIKVRGALSDGGKSGDGDGSSRVEILKEVFTTGEGGDFDDEADGKDFDDDGTDIAITGRIDILLSGSWKQYKDFTSWPGEDLFAYVGGAVHYEVNETGAATSDADNDNFLMWTVDGGVEYKGFSVYAAFVMLHTDYDDSDGSDPEDYDPWGLVVQAGYNIDLGNGDSIEPFVRYEHIDFDDALTDQGSSDETDELDVLTVGVNWYHKKHNAKFTADVVWFFDNVSDDFDIGQSGGGGLDDALGNDDQFVVRLQYQLLF